MHWLDSLHMYLCNIIKQLWLRSESHFIQPCLCLCNHYFLLEAHAWWTDNEGHYNSAVELNNNQSKRWMRTWNLPRSRYLNLCVLSPDLSREICINLCVCLCLSFQKEAWHHCEVSDPNVMNIHELILSVSQWPIIVSSLSACVISLALAWRGLICNYVVRCHKALAVRRMRMDPGH